MEVRSRDNATVNAAGFDKVCPVSQHLTRQLSAVNPLVDGKRDGGDGGERGGFPLVLFFFLEALSWANHIFNTSVFSLPVTNYFLCILILCLHCKHA